MSKRDDVPAVTPITEDEWRAAEQAAADVGKEIADARGFTLQELMKMWKVNRRKANWELERRIDDGKWKWAGKKRCPVTERMAKCYLPILPAKK